MSFPDVPFDEKLFESNELLRSYWDRATDSVTRELPEGFLESEDLREMTDETFMDKTVPEAHVPRPEIADEVIQEVIHAKTVEENSDLVFEKSTPPSGDGNTKWVIISFVVIFVVTFINSKFDRY